MVFIGVELGGGVVGGVETAEERGFAVVWVTLAETNVASVDFAGEGAVIDGAERRFEDVVLRFGVGGDILREDDTDWAKRRAGCEAGVDVRRQAPLRGPCGRDVLDVDEDVLVLAAEDGVVAAQIGSDGIDRVVERERGSALDGGVKQEVDLSRQA